MRNDFSLARKRIGIYINMPEFSWSCQMQKDCTPTPEVLEALKAAFDAYQAVEDKHRKSKPKDSK